MVNSGVEIKTNSFLLEALRNAAQVKQTAQDRLEQRVSYIFGSVDADNGITKDRIRQFLVNEDGLRSL